jgi:selenocysteine lyase/cysteine desulfurase
MEIQQLVFLKHLLRFKRHVYLDHNTTTHVSRHVRRTMNHVLKYCYGNPSSSYGFNRRNNTNFFDDDIKVNLEEYV